MDATFLLKSDAMSSFCRQARRLSRGSCADTKSLPPVMAAAPTGEVVQVSVREQQNLNVLSLPATQECVKRANAIVEFTRSQHNARPVQVQGILTFS